MDLLGPVKQDGPRVDSRQVKGILCTVTAAVIWVLASFVVQKVEDQGLSPVILSYIANSLFVVFLPLDYGLQTGVCSPAKYQRYSLFYLFWLSQAVVRQGCLPVIKIPVQRPS